MQKEFSSPSALADFESHWQNSLQPDRSAFKQHTRHDGSSDDPPTANPSRQKHSPWEDACDAARDAWDQVFNAIADGSQAKPSAR